MEKIGRNQRDPGYKSKVLSFSLSEREVGEFVRDAHKYDMGVSGFVRFLYGRWRYEIQKLEPRDEREVELGG